MLPWASWPFWPARPTLCALTGTKSNGSAVPRNSFRQPSFFNWDMRLLKDLAIGDAIRLAFSFEAFNLSEASNKNFGPDQKSLYGRGPAPDVNFGVPLEAPTSARFGGARQVQLGARLTF
jgi:hypothetical protein